ncbi:hypothetical protein [Dissulfuribacter thermophilus]|nr:hypothetical protein [Dissulfuribacter thermophilus]
MMTDLELLKLSIPDRYFKYSKAYGSAAKILAERIVKDKDQATWPNAAVILMLTAHSVELFLKGAILKKDSKADRKIRHHHIESLYEMYCEIYKDEKYSFNLPFKTEYLGMSQAEIDVLKKNRNKKNRNKYSEPSVLYRYPTASGESEWEGVYAFEASSFFSKICQLLEDIHRLRKSFT